MHPKGCRPRSPVFAVFLGDSMFADIPTLSSCEKTHVPEVRPKGNTSIPKNQPQKGHNKHHHIAAIYPIYELQNCKLMMYERYVYVDIYIYIPEVSNKKHLWLGLPLSQVPSWCWVFHGCDQFTNLTQGHLGIKPSQSTSPHWRRAMSVWSNLSTWFPSENDPGTELTFWVHMGIRFVGQILGQENKDWRLAFPSDPNVHFFQHQSPSKNIVQHQKRSKTKQTWLLIDW